MTPNSAFWSTFGPLLETSETPPHVHEMEMPMIRLVCGVSWSPCCPQVVWGLGPKGVDIYPIWTTLGSLLERSRDTPEMV